MLNDDHVKESNSEDYDMDNEFDNKFSEDVDYGYRIQR
jgi:hypothetical protein